MCRCIDQIDHPMAAAALGSLLAGCTSLHDYIHNGFKVGPNYCPPDSPRGRALDRCRRHPAAGRHREPERGGGRSSTTPS